MSAPEAAASVLDARAFRDTLGHFPTGVVVITALADTGRPAGMVIGSFTSVSLDPPLVAFLPARDSGSFAAMRTAASFCVNVLGADQETVCRQFAMPGGADKFDGVAWAPAPSGAPILDDVVAWIDCTFEQVIEAGDHYIVVGAVTALGVSRSTLPLLFFQGGYGRFSPVSLVAPPNPDLIESVRRAEAIRDEVEHLADELGVECSVLCEVGSDAVCVVSANRSGRSGLISLGAAIPLMPPLGAVFHTDSTEDEIEAWLNRAPGLTDDLRTVMRQNLEAVTRRGYSLSLKQGHPVGSEFEAAFAAYAAGQRLPQQERRLRQDLVTAISAYEPEIDPAQSYDVHSVIVGVPGDPGPRMAVRMGQLRPGIPGSTLLRWIERLRSVADHVPAGN